MWSKRHNRRAATLHRFTGRKWMVVLPLFVVAAWTSVSGVPALAAGEVKVGPVVFDTEVATRDGPLPLRGTGLKTFLLLKVVAAGLYATQDVASEDILSDVPKHIEVVYLVNIPRAELHRATRDGIRKNVSEEVFARLQDQIAQINAYYPDVGAQDRIGITYLPGRGCRVFVNGELQGTVEGEEFAFAFFSIWVGENPVDRRIKSRLLGGTP